MTEAAYRDGERASSDFAANQVYADPAVWRAVSNHGLARDARRIGYCSTARNQVAGRNFTMLTAAILRKISAPGIGFYIFQYLSAILKKNGGGAIIALTGWRPGPRSRLPTNRHGSDGTD